MPWVRVRVRIRITVRVRVHLFCGLIHRDGMNQKFVLLSTKEYVCSKANVLRCLSSDMCLKKRP